MKKVLLQDAIDQFVELKKSRYKCAGDNYEYKLRLFKDHCKKEYINDIDSKDIIFYQDLITLRYKNGYVVRLMQALQALIEYWRERTKLKLYRSDIEIPFMDHIKRPVVTRDDYYKIIFYLKDKYIIEKKIWNLQELIIVKLLWETAMRVSELIAFDVNDISLKNRERKIIKEKSHGLEKLILMSEETQFFLKIFIYQRICLSLLKKEYDQDGALFIGVQKKTRLSRHSIDHLLENICKEVFGKRKYSAHSFRHGVAHDLIFNYGASTKETQIYLGHQNISSTDRYLVTDIKEERFILNKFKDRLNYSKEEDLQKLNYLC